MFLISNIQVSSINENIHSVILFNLDHLKLLKWLNLLIIIEMCLIIRVKADQESYKMKLKGDILCMTF